MELVIEPAIIEDKLRLGERFNNGVLEKHLQVVSAYSFVTYQITLHS